MRSCTIAVLCVASFCSLCPPAFAAKQRPAAQPAPAALTAQSVNDSVPGAKADKGANAATIKAGVLLDRAGFSPGVIDGRDGENFKKALVAFQKENGLQTSGRLDQQTWSALAEGSDQPVLVEYEIAPADVKGPFLRKLPRRSFSRRCAFPLEAERCCSSNWIAIAKVAGTSAMPMARASWSSFAESSRAGWLSV